MRTNRYSPPATLPAEKALQAGTSHIRIQIPDGDLQLFPQLFSPDESDALLKKLRRDICWQQQQVRVYGRMHDQPRLTAWHGDPGIQYRYSGLQLETSPWNKELVIIKKRIESISSVEFNSVLLNLYRDGADSMGWHSDDEPELGRNPVIGSVSFGEERALHLQHKRQKDLRQKLLLPHGSYLLSQGETQHHWRHHVPKSRRPMGVRLNLTFRVIKTP